MLLKALIATLVVSSSALALTATANAAPAPVHRLLTAQHVECAPTVSEWTVLSAKDRLTNQRADIRVGSWNRYNELKLVTEGKNTIERVVITFANGKQQRAYPYDKLDTRNPSLTIPLQGGERQIKDIQVFGVGGQHSSFEILAA